jgi:hypothetical protein
MGMHISHRLAAGAVALAAVLTPTVALAAGSRSPRPVAPGHRAAVHRTHRSHAGATAPAPGPAPSRAPVPAGVRRLDRDMDRLQHKVSDAAFTAGIPKWVACMNHAGLPTVATSSGPTAGGWTFGTATTPRARFLESLAGENAADMIQARCAEQTYNL